MLVTDETIRDIQLFGVTVMGELTGLKLKRNTIERFDRDLVGASPISFEVGVGGAGLVLRDNTCDGPAASSINLINFGSPGLVTHWDIAGNRSISPTLVVNYEYFPVAGMGAHGNRGWRTMVAGEGAATITTKRCMANSRVVVQQRGGADPPHHDNTRSGELHLHAGLPCCRRRGR